MARRPRTPCVGICSTGIGDSVCRGCKRFAQEVIDWNRYSEHERLAVLDRLDQLLVQTVSAKFEIHDQARLLEQIKYQQIACDFDRDPYCWLFELLRFGAGQIDDLKGFGVHRREEWRHQPLTDIKAAIDREHYTLSCAYYERYIVPGEKAVEKIG